MKKIRTALVVLTVTTLMAPQAEARSLDKIFTECGLGAMIFPTVPVASAISNIIWDFGTTATSTDLSTPENCNGVKAKVAMLIGNSFDTLETEIAEGKGQYLETLSTLSGKSTATIRKAFGKTLRAKNYEAMRKMEKAEKLFAIVNK